MGLSARARESIALGVATLATFLAYAFTASRHALGGDGGELAALFLRGGVAHPPGYPLFVLWMRAFAWLPFSEPAHAAAIATALLASLLVPTAFVASRAFGASSRAAGLVTAILVTSPLTWKLATYPEVFAGNAVLALVLVWLASPAPPVRGMRRALALAFVAGLGLAHHHTIVLLAPLGLFAFAESVRESDRRVLVVPASLAAFAAGLAPYAYAWLAARGAFGADVILWGDTSTWSGLVHHFLRRDYGTLTLGSRPQARAPFDQLLFLARTTITAFLALPIFAVLSLFVARARVLPTIHFREPRVWLLASALLAGPTFIGSFNIPPRGVGALIVERFDLLPAVLLLVFVAPAFDMPLARFSRTMCTLVVGIVALAQSSRALPELAEHHRPTVQRYAENALRIVEPGAVIVGSGDHRAGSFMYAAAHGLRSDVTFVQPWLLLSEPYRKRTSARLGIDLVAPRNQVLDVNALLRQLLDAGRPVYLTDWPAAGLERDFPSYPVGNLIRLIDDPRRVMPPVPLLALNERVFADLVLDGAPPERDTWSGSLYADYARPWLVLRQAFANMGDEDAARACAERAAAFTPR